MAQHFLGLKPNGPGRSGRLTVARSKTAKTVPAPKPGRSRIRWRFNDGEDFLTDELGTRIFLHEQREELREQNTMLEMDRAHQDELRRQTALDKRQAKLDAQVIDVANRLREKKFEFGAPGSWWMDRLWAALKENRPKFATKPWLRRNVDAIRNEIKSTRE